MVPGIIVLVGKIAFLAALYGFLYVVYRGLLIETRRGARPRATPPQDVPFVERWELRPPAPAGAVLHPTPPPAQADPPDEPEASTPEAPSEAPTAEPPATDEPDRTLQIALPEPEALVTESPPVEPTSPDATRGEQTSPGRQEKQAPEPQRPVAELVILTSPEAGLDSGRRLEIDASVTLGRAAHNHIVLQDRFVSAHHAEIERRDDTFVLRDLGSTNGTFRNGARIEGDVTLQDGDRIGIGTSVFAFRTGA